MHGAGQEEAPGRPVPVDRPLQVGEQPRRQLHLVQHRPRRQVLDEADRVIAGVGERVALVEAPVLVFREAAQRRRPRSRPAQRPGQRRLAALSRAVQQDRRRILQRLGQPGRREAGVQGGFGGLLGHARRDGFSRAEIVQRISRMISAWIFR